MMPGLILALAAAAAAAPPPDTGAVPAATDTAAAQWRASLVYGFEDFTSSWTTWQSWTARLERKSPSGSVALEAATASRFGLWDQGGALDTYHLLWRRAYGNVRLGLAPGARVTPRLDFTTEVYQGLPGDWEASAGYRRMNYAGSGVNLWGASLARYAGNWYLVARLTAVPQSGRLGGGVSLLVRRYLETADDFLDVSGGTGAEVVTLAADSVAVERSRFLAVRLQRFVTTTVGFALAATYNTQQGIPTRRGLSLGAMYRW